MNFVRKHNQKTMKTNGKCENCKFANTCSKKFNNASLENFTPPTKEVIKAFTQKEHTKLYKEKLTPHSTFVEKFKEEQKWRKIHPKLAKLQDIWWWIRYGIWNKISEFPREVKYFIQRGKRGFSDRDSWGFDYFLAKVIFGGIDKLIKNTHGYPNNLKNLKQWKTILRKIKKTFSMAVKISDGELIYLPTEQYDYKDEKRKYWIKYTKENNKEWEKNDRVMMKKENLAYLKGWEYFRIYFGDLWD